MIGLILEKVLSTGEKKYSLSVRWNILYISVTSS